MAASAAAAAHRFQRVVVATDLEPDDVAMLYTLCKCASDAGISQQSMYVMLGEGSLETKSMVWHETKRALEKEFGDMNFQVAYTGVETGVEYDLFALDAEFNFPSETNVLRGGEAFWHSALSRATLVICTRPPREWLEIRDACEKLPDVDAPLFLYGGYNLRACGWAEARKERLGALATHFKGGVHIVERGSFLGEDFDPMVHLPRFSVLEEPATAFAGVLRRLCGVWNKKMAEHKTGTLRRNFHLETSFAVYLADPTLEHVKEACANGWVHNPPRAVMDHIALDACRKHPYTSLLWADPLVVALAAAPPGPGMFETHALADAGDITINPAFELAVDGAFLVPKQWHTLSTEERAARRTWVAEMCEKLFLTACE